MCKMYSIQWDSLTKYAIVSNGWVPSVDAGHTCVYIVYSLQADTFACIFELRLSCFPCSCSCYCFFFIHLVKQNGKLKCINVCADRHLWSDANTIKCNIEQTCVSIERKNIDEFVHCLCFVSCYFAQHSAAFQCIPFNLVLKSLDSSNIAIWKVRKKRKKEIERKKKNLVTQ